MFGGIAIILILFIVIPRLFDNRNHYTEEQMDKPRGSEQYNSFSGAKSYTEYISNLSYHEMSVGEYIFFFFISGLVFALIGSGMELMFANTLGSAASAIIGMFVFPFCAAIYFVAYLSSRETKKEELHKKLYKYISWSQDDKDFLAADCFFCNLIMENRITETELVLIKNFRDHCRKKEKVDLISAENYLRALNVIRKKKGFKVAYDSLFKRIEAEKKILETNITNKPKLEKKKDGADIAFALANVRKQFEMKASNYNTKEVIPDEELLEMLNQYKSMNMEDDLLIRAENNKYRMDDGLFDFLMGYFVARKRYEQVEEETGKNNESQFYKEESETYLAELEEYEDPANVEIEIEGLDYEELSMMDEFERNEIIESEGLDPDDYDFDHNGFGDVDSDNRDEYYFEEDRFGNDEMYNYDGELRDY